MIDPELDVHIEAVEVQAPPGSVDTDPSAPVLQVLGLESAFAVPVAADHRSIDPAAGEQLTAHPDGALGPPESLGWHSLAVPVRAIGNELDVRDIALTYRVGDGSPVRGRLDMAWRLCLDDCGQTCRLPADEDVARAEPAEWTTVFAASDAGSWEVTTDLPG